LQKLFWTNFNSVKLAHGLIPKLAPCSKMSSSNFHYASFNSVENKLRSRYSAEIPEFGLQTQEPEERRVERQSIDIHSSSSTDGNGQQAQGGIFNMVYNYFTPGTEEEEEAHKDYIASG